MIRKTSFFLLGVVAMVFLVGAGYVALPDGKLHLYFLDVGQGDSSLIITPGGKKVLIDGGMGEVVVRRLAEELAYFDNYIDVVVLTHPDRDHMEGLVEVVRRYEIGSVWLPMVSKDEDFYEVFMREVSEKGFEVNLIDGSWDIELEGGVILDFILVEESPGFEEVRSANAKSVVVRLDYYETEALITGDIEEEQEVGLLEMAVELESEVLKVPHHGSKTSSVEMFIEAVSPEWAVISCGKDNPFGHPHEEVLERYEEEGVKYIRTDEVGTVRFFSDGVEWGYEEKGWFSFL